MPQYLCNRDCFTGEMFCRKGTIYDFSQDQKVPEKHFTCLDDAEIPKDQVIDGKVKPISMERLEEMTEEYFSFARMWKVRKADLRRVIAECNGNKQSIADWIDEQKKANTWQLIGGVRETVETKKEKLGMATTLKKRKKSAEARTE